MLISVRKAKFGLKLVQKDRKLSMNKHVVRSKHLNLINYTKKTPPIEEPKLHKVKHCVFSCSNVFFFSTKTIIQYLGTFLWQIKEFRNTFGRNVK